MNSGFEAVWLYIKALLPPGLEGALEPGGRENGIIPTNFHGLDSSESEDAIKALLNRVEASLE